MTDLVLQLPPQRAATHEQLRTEAARAMGIQPSSVGHITITRRSIDARQDRKSVV